jgi:hypothetical protein
MAGRRRGLRRFILQSDIERFQALLREEADAQARERLIASLAEAKRELARLSATEEGVRWGPAPPGSLLQRGGSLASEFQRRLEASDRELFLVEPGPGLHIVDVSEPFAQSALIDRAAVAGELLFEVFPDNPDDEHASGVSNLFASIARSAQTGRSDVMPIQRYDVRGAAGEFVERYWQPVNSPVFDESGHLAYILHETKDVTAEVLAEGREGTSARFPHGADYRLQLMDEVGCPELCVEFRSSDDASAERKAETLRCGQGAELWRGRKWLNTWAALH